MNKISSKRTTLLFVMTSILVAAGCEPSPPSSVFKTDVPEADSKATDAVAGEEDSVGVVEENDAIAFGDKFPEVLAVNVSPANGNNNGNNYRFNVTLSSVYDSPQRYADAWRVLDEQDNELAVRVLTHDHASEQPFTRSKMVEVPTGTSIVFVEGRDKANGWSGQRFRVEIP